MNYYLREEEKVVLRALEARRGGPKVLILEGPPGTGKTALSQYLAERWKAKYFYYLCHHWTSDEELFVGVNVGRVAAGVERPQDAYEYGVLSKAALATQEGRAVLCLDELDKAPQRAESLLLDFLQHGRVVLPDGQIIQAVLGNITVVITTNGIRPLMEATLRRGFRVQMQFLPPHVEADVIRKRTGAPMGPIRTIVRMINTIRERGATKPSLQEAINLATDLQVAESAQDVEILIKGWLCKEPEDWQALVGACPNPGATLWGEWRRVRIDVQETSKQIY